MGIPLLAFYLSTNWYQLMLIQGNSMAPSYKHLQMVLLNRHSRDYTYGDVVAFYSDELSCVLVKRIAACPGDTAVIKNRTLYVNDKVSEVFPQGFSFQYAGVLSQQAMLEPESYLVLGDNISESKDSRYPEVGFVSDGKIIGKINGAETTAKLLSVR